MAAAWIEKIIGSGVGSFIEKAGGVIAKIGEGHTGKKEALIQLQQLATAEFGTVQETLQAELQSKERIIVAELQQDDKFTKRARPFVIYCGPVVAIIIAGMHYAAHYMGTTPPPTPEVVYWFFGGWTSFGSVYAFSRSKYDKTAQQNKFSQLVTGGKFPNVKGLNILGD